MDKATTGWVNHMYFENTDCTTWTCTQPDSDDDDCPWKTRRLILLEVGFSPRTGTTCCPPPDQLQWSRNKYSMLGSYYYVTRIGNCLWDMSIGCYDCPVGTTQCYDFDKNWCEKVHSTCGVVCYWHDDIIGCLHKGEYIRHLDLGDTSFDIDSTDLNHMAITNVIQYTNEIGNLTTEEM
eukprot:UN24187